LHASRAACVAVSRARSASNAIQPPSATMISTTISDMRTRPSREALPAPLPDVDMGAGAGNASRARSIRPAATLMREPCLAPIERGRTPCMRLQTGGPQHSHHENGGLATAVIARRAHHFGEAQAAIQLIGGDVVGAQFDLDRRNAGGHR